MMTVKIEVGDSSLVITGCSMDTLLRLVKKLENQINDNQSVHVNINIDVKEEK